MTIALLLILLVFLRLVLKRYLVADYSIKISDTPGKNMDRWSMVLLALIAICMYFFVLDNTSQNTTSWFWLILFSVGMAFRTWMDWKYVKGSKEYRVSLILFAVGLAYILVFVF